MSAGVVGGCIGDLIRIVDATLWKVKNVDADRTETCDVYLPDRAECCLSGGAVRIRSVKNRADVRFKLDVVDDSGESGVEPQRRVKQERDVRKVVLGRRYWLLRRSSKFKRVRPYESRN